MLLLFLWEVIWRAVYSETGGMQAKEKRPNEAAVPRQAKFVWLLNALQSTPRLEERNGSKVRIPIITG